MSYCWAKSSPLDFHSCLSTTTKKNTIILPPVTTNDSVKFVIYVLGSHFTLFTSIISSQKEAIFLPPPRFPSTFRHKCVSKLKYNIQGSEIQSWTVEWSKVVWSKRFHSPVAVTRVRWTVTQSNRETRCLRIMCWPALFGLICGLAARMN